MLILQTGCVRVTTYVIHAFPSVVYGSRDRMYYRSGVTQSSERVLARVRVAMCRRTIFSAAGRARGRVIPLSDVSDVLPIAYGVRSRV